MKYRHYSEDALSSIQMSIIAFCAGLGGFAIWTMLFLTLGENAILLGVYGIVCFVFSLIELFIARHKEKEFIIRKTINKLLCSEGRKMLEPTTYYRVFMENYYGR